MQTTKRHPKKLLPHPRFSILLLVLWLLMNESLAFAHILLGLGLAWIIPFSSQQFWLEQSSLHHPTKILSYATRLAVDIARSNVAVAIRILRGAKGLQPAFIDYPLTIQHDFAITILASTISLTPGTVSAHISKDKKHLLIHVLHLEDEEQLRTDIFERYEQPLKEIFAC